MKVENLIAGKLFKKIHSKVDLCCQFLREHGILPTGVQCPKCHTACKLTSMSGVVAIIKSFVLWGLGFIGLNKIRYLEIS